MVNAQGLEAILSHVRNLSHDMHHAKIVIRNEVGHLGFVGWSEGGRGSGVNKYIDESWNTDEPEISEPDTQRREDALQELQEVYSSCECYSARYIAGKSIGVPYGELEGRINSWLGELRNHLDSTKIVEKKVIVGEHVEVKHYKPEKSDDRRAGEHRVESEQYDYELREFELVDQEKRLTAIQDLGTLFRLCRNPGVKIMLDFIYNGNFNSHLDYGDEDVDISGNDINLGFSSRIRGEAGKALGYSLLRIWAHEHPLKATIAGIASTGAASGLVYMAYQFLAR